MSQPKRYDLFVDANLQAEEGGEWVKWDDYADLAAENERLRKAGDVMAIMLQHDEVSKAWLAAKGVQP